MKLNLNIYLGMMMNVIEKIKQEYIQQFGIDGKIEKCNDDIKSQYYFLMGFLSTVLDEKDQQMPSSISIEINRDEFELMKQWFHCIQDVHPAYLKKEDYQLSKKIHDYLGYRVSSSIMKKIKP